LAFADFSAAEKARDVQFCIRVGLLSGQVFSHFGELWLAWSHGGGITSEMSYIEIAVGQSELGAVAWWNWGRRRRAGGVVGFASCKPADALV